MAATALEAPRPRIRVQGVAFLGAALLLLAVAGVSARQFITPDVSHEYRLGPASAFAPGTVTSLVYDGEQLEPFARSSPSAAWGWPATYPVPAGDLVYVVRLPSGELRVLAGVSPHLGQQVVWFPDAEIEVGESRGFFGDDFSFWTVDGTRVFGPSPRDLPTYRYHLDDDGALVVDLSETVPGPQRVGSASGDVPPPYDFTSPGWPTSGWPSR